MSKSSHRGMMSTTSVELLFGKTRNDLRCNRPVVRYKRTRRFSSLLLLSVPILFWEASRPVGATGRAKDPFEPIRRGNDPSGHRKIYSNQDTEIEDRETDPVTHRFHHQAADLSSQSKNSTEPSNPQFTLLPSRTPISRSSPSPSLATSTRPSPSVIDTGGPTSGPSELASTAISSFPSVGGRASEPPRRKGPHHSSSPVPQSSPKSAFTPSRAPFTRRPSARSVLRSSEPFHLEHPLSLSSDQVVVSLLTSLHPSDRPTSVPTISTISPTSMHSSLPSVTGFPTMMPSNGPTNSKLPSILPSDKPTSSPTSMSSSIPSLTQQPSRVASNEPTISQLLSFQPSDEPTLTLSTSPTLNLSTSPTLTLSTSPTSMPSLSPTSMPSLSPSITTQPSVIPSITPTNSKLPSAHPSHNPTSIPTKSPSAMHSSFPSLTQQPSPQPSNSPTDSKLPSLLPSNLHSSTPTTSPTLMPSLPPSISGYPSPLPSNSPTNSKLPSIQPSEKPTSTPTTSPTSMPSLFPSITMQPSVIPSINPTNSKLPSAHPSDKPTSTPTTSPTSMPSSFPTLTQHPSRGPSNGPTLSNLPSVRPSNFPSTVPSVLPTMSPSQNPSSLPSTAPSTAPTKTCHDNSNYRNPITNLSCKHHQGTLCDNWHHVGLSLSETVDLIENCPESCNIECGTFSIAPSAPDSSNFSDVFATLEFILVSVPSLMDATTQKEFEEMSMIHFSTHIRDVAPESEIRMKRVRLTSQTVLPAPSRNLRSLTTLDAPSDAVTLSVVTEIWGRGPSHDPATFSALTLLAVDDPSYAALLSRSRFFRNVFVSSDRAQKIQATRPDTAIAAREGGPREGTAGVLLAAVGALALIASVTGVLVFHRRRRRHHHATGRDSSGAFFASSPKGFDGMAPGSSNGLNALSSSIFSVEESPRHNLTIFVDHATLEYGSRSRDSWSSSRDGEEAERGRGTEDSKTEIMNAHADIPPMIIIENIEQNFDSDFGVTGQESENELDHKRSDSSKGLFVRHIEASSAFARAVAAKSQRSAAPTLHEMISTLTTHDGDGDEVIDLTSPTACWKRPGSRRNRPRLRIDTDQNRDADSVASTPAIVYTPAMANTNYCMTPIAPSPTHRKCLSSGALNKIEASDLLNELILSEWGNLGLGPAKNNYRDDPKDAVGYCLSVGSSLEELERVATSGNDRARRSMTGNVTAGITAGRKVAAVLGEPESSLDDLIGVSSELKLLEEEFDASRSPRPSSPRRPRRYAGRRNATPRGAPDDTTAGESTYPSDRHDRQQQHPEAGKKQKLPTRGPAEPRISRRHQKRKDDDYGECGNSIFSAVSGTSGCSKRIDVAVIPGSANGSRAGSPTMSEGSGAVSAHKPRNNRTTFGANRMRTWSDDSKYGVFQYTFDAPGSGKLGIIIESSKNRGPTIHTVKDYSPLFGMVESGDRIIRVNGENTRHMSTSQVTKLLTKKREEKKDQMMIRITVVSPFEKPDFRCENQIQEAENEIRTELYYVEKDLLSKPSQDSKEHDIITPTTLERADLEAYKITFDHYSGADTEAPPPPHGDQDSNALKGKQGGSEHGANRDRVMAEHETGSKNTNCSLFDQEIPDEINRGGSIHLLGFGGSDTDDESSVANSMDEDYIS